MRSHIMRKRVLGFLSLAAFILIPIVVLHAADQGKLKTKVNPGRAGVFVDGKYLGPAANFAMARTYLLPAGEHEVKLVEPRYKEITTKVTITPGKTTIVRETMQALPLPKPPFGRLRTVASDKFAAVYVNNQFMGHVDEFSNFAQGLLLNPGEYTVRIVPTGGGQPYEEKVNIKENQVVVVHAKP
jgi:hypothetical protein